MSQPLPETRMHLAPEVEARIRSWMQAADPMDVASKREHDACVEVLRRLREQPETTPEERAAMRSLKRLTEEYRDREMRFSFPLNQIASARVKAFFEESKRVRLERAAAATEPAPRSGMYTDWRGHRRLFIRPEPGVRYACPCCRFLTLPERNGYDVCSVCFWEDDGQDDHDADEVRGGSNHDLSLTEARANFSEFGASERRHIVHVRAPLDRERP